MSSYSWLDQHPAFLDAPKYSYFGISEMFQLCIMKVIFIVFPYFNYWLTTVLNLKDTMAIHPSNFGIPPDEVLISEINKKYANRILHDVGLCICAFDLSEAGEGKVRYGDGCLWYKGGWKRLLRLRCENFKKKEIFSGISVGCIPAIHIRSDYRQSQVVRWRWYSTCIF